MTTYLILTFVFGYLLITVEDFIKINKSATALFTGIVLWVIFIMMGEGHGDTHGILVQQLGHISEILFFLMGAMTIIELIDIHQGFDVITNRIKTRDRRKLLWLISFLAFFMSALLDNLTTSIVMYSLIRKMMVKKKDQYIYAGILIIACNAGGAWSPIGDITTTMLWIGGQISTGAIITNLFFPSVVALLVPVIIMTFRLNGKLARRGTDYERRMRKEKIKGSKLMLFTGIGALVFVPIFKTVTHLPPYMGMLFGLSLVWIVSEVIHFKKDEEHKKPYTAVHALSKIDTSSVLFFLGILMAVGSLEHAHLLNQLAANMNESIGNLDFIVFLMGILSSIVDNVPLVAASMGMYSLAEFPMDHKLWEFIAYCAGTGGSMLIIGSAAGVAVMGMAKIKFFWYLKNITLPAFIGYVAGAIFYLLEFYFFK